MDNVTLSSLKYGLCCRTPGYMVPIFTSDEVYGKVEKLQDKVSAV